MAIIVKCMTCGVKDVGTSVRNPFAECEECQKKNNRYQKKWHEMTLEEKVENLNRRISRSETYNTLIG
jgi:hypothetical protein